MKIILALFCILCLTYADEYIKDIKDEIYSIKKFKKYQDAPYPEPAFVDSNSVKLLGWSKNNYLAYFIGSNGVNMSDSCFGYLIIRDIYNDNIIYVGGFESLNLYELDELYKKHESKIKETLKKYHVKFEEKLFFKRDKSFSMKNIYKKAPYPMGFGNFSNYLESISLYDDKKELCAYEVMHRKTYHNNVSDGIYYNVLDASLLGVANSPTTHDITAVAIVYIQTNGAEGNSADIKIITCSSSDTKVMYIDDFPNNSLYSFCKATGIKESEIRKLNPWINKKSSNIPADTEIIIPKLKEE